MDNLLALNRGQTAIVTKVVLDRETKERLLALGLYTGACIVFERSAPLKDPQQYLVGDQFISIRKDLACHIYIQVVEKI